MARRTGGPPTHPERSCTLSVSDLARARSDWSEFFAVRDSCTGPRQYGEDVVSTVTLPLGVHGPRDFDGFCPGRIASVVELYKSSHFAQSGLPTVRFKLVHLSMQPAPDGGEGGLLAAFQDARGRLHNLKGVRTALGVPYFFTNGCRLRSVTKVLLGRFATAAEIPITSRSIRSEFCFCRPSVRHLAGRDAPDMLAACDECGHWCHVRCLVETGLIPKNYDESTR